MVYEGALVTVPDSTPEISAYNSPPRPKSKKRLSPVQDLIHATPTKSEDLEAICHTFEVERMRQKGDYNDYQGYTHELTTPFGIKMNALMQAQIKAK